MPHRWLLPLIVLVVLLLDGGTAFAQTAVCQQLASQLKTLERNGDFREAQRNSQRANQLAASLQDDESAYVRNGCNADAKAGRQLTRSCQTLARNILKGRADYAALSKNVSTGNAVAAQREAILQDISRFGCSNRNSQVTINGSNRRETLFDRLFGGFTDGNDQGGSGDGAIVGDQFSGFGGYTTVRTLCVRLSDGYFWPISYSTLRDYVGNDAASCQEQCPGTPVDLYYYKNPGEEPEQMINIAGEPYSNLPTAFAYRKQFDDTSVCKPTENTGVITIAGGGEQVNGRAVITFNEATFPMPMRDPRRAQQVTVAPLEVAQAVSVPLPRPRPDRDALGVPQPIAAPVQTEQARVVQFGDKTVRIVGPDTPYAQVVAKGT